MRAKRKPLDAAAFASVAVLQPDPVQSAAGPRRSPMFTGAAARSRAGKVPIQGYYSEDVRRRMKILAAKTGRTVEDLLGEAIHDLLTKHPD